MATQEMRLKKRLYFTLCRISEHNVKESSQALQANDACQKSGLDIRTWTPVGDQLWSGLECVKRNRSEAVSQVYR